MFGTSEFSPTNGTLAGSVGATESSGTPNITYTSTVHGTVRRPTCFCLFAIHAHETRALSRTQSLTVVTKLELLCKLLHIKRFRVLALNHARRTNDIRSKRQVGRSPAPATHTWPQYQQCSLLHYNIISKAPAPARLYSYGISIPVWKGTETSLSLTLDLAVRACAARVSSVSVVVTVL